MYYWTRGSDELGAHDLDGRERWLGERGAGKRDAGDLQRHGQTCGGWRSGMGRWMGAGNGGRDAWLLHAVGWYLEYASTWIDAVLMISPSKLCALEAVPAEGRGGGVALALVEKTGGGGER